MCAARTGQLDCVRHLLNYRADTESRDGEGHTALWCAVRDQSNYETPSSLKFVLNTEDEASQQEVRSL
mgnify:FL=1